MPSKSMVSGMTNRFGLLIVNLLGVINLYFCRLARRSPDRRIYVQLIWAVPQDNVERQPKQLIEGIFYPSPKRSFSEMDIE